MSDSPAHTWLHFSGEMRSCVVDKSRDRCTAKKCIVCKTVSTLNQTHWWVFEFLYYIVIKYISVCYLIQLIILWIFIEFIRLLRHNAVSLILEMLLIFNTVFFSRIKMVMMSSHMLDAWVWSVKTPEGALSWNQSPLPLYIKGIVLPVEITLLFWLTQTVHLNCLKLFN